MFRNFAEIEQYLKKQKIVKRVAVAGAQDDIALPAIVRAKNNGFIEPILIGDEEKIRALLEQLGEDPSDFEIIAENREMKTAKTAISLVKDGSADIPMKGLMQTSSFLMAVKNPLGGIVSPDTLLNEVTVFEYPEQDRMIVLGDCAVNIAPSFEEKIQIIKNLSRVAQAFDADEVLVAAVSVLEKVNPEIPSTGEAAKLAELDWGENVIVEGPFGLDNALDREAAAHKGIESRVAGNANVLLMPDLHGGNLLHKAIHFFGHYRFSSGLCGSDIPIIMNSRTDDAEAKYCSILSAILQA